jgi:hypothetical protein
MTKCALDDNGLMAAVFGPVSEIEKILAEIDGYVVIANINSSKESVIGGNTEAVAKAMEALRASGYRVQQLQVSHAFHTKIVAPAGETLTQVLAKMKLQPASEHPHGLPDRDFDALFTKDKPIVFAFHGYPWLIHRLTYRRTNHKNLHVRGYKEEGTTTTPFDMVVLNDLDRFHLVEDVIDRLLDLFHGGHYFQVRSAIHPEDEFHRIEIVWAGTAEQTTKMAEELHRDLKGSCGILQELPGTRGAPIVHEEIGHPPVLQDDDLRILPAHVSLSV